MKPIGRIVQRSLLLTTACAIVGVTIVAQQPEAAKAGARQTLRLKALSSDDWLLRRRAVQEFSYLAPLEAKSLTNVLLLATEVRNGDTYDTVGLLAQTAVTKPSAFDDALRRSTGRARALLCCAIGRGSASRPNVVAILNEVATSDQSTARSAAHIALANLNIERTRSIEILREVISSHPREVEDILQYMLFAKVGGWAAESLGQQLKEVLQNDDDTAVLAFVLAASWGEKGRFATDVVRARAGESKLGTGGAAANVVYAFSEARLSSRQTNWLTADLVRRLGSEHVGFDHTVAAACLLISECLLEDSDVSALGLFLEGKQSEVVLGATRLCWALGLRARQMEEQMLRLVETSPDRQLRGAAAMGLGQAGTEVSASRLSELLTRERDETVREAIISAISTTHLRESSVN